MKSNYLYLSTITSSKHAIFYELNKNTIQEKKMTDTENVEKFETQKIEETTPKRENPLIQRAKLPGETFALPSGGIFYETGELDDTTNDGEIHIYPMAAYDEVVIKTPSLLLNGQAIEEVFKRCIPQIVKPLDLLAKDVDFILVALRQVTYGKLMDMNFVHDCKDAKEHSYQVDISKFISGAKKINPTTVGKTYKVTLTGPGISQTVELRPARYREIVDMLQLYTLENDESEDLIESAKKETKGMLSSIMSVIRSVDGNKDTDLIYEWLEFIKAEWVDKLTKSIEKTSNWGAKFEHKDKCKDCSKPIIIQVPINPISFFTLR